MNKSLLDLNEEIKEKNQQYINEKVIWEYLIQSLSGLLYLHENKIYIRDIRPENLLIDENENLKISNFELCEIKSENEDDFKTDIYRLGSAFFFIMSDRSLDSKFSPFSIISSNGKAKCLSDFYSEKLRLFIEKLLFPMV